MYRRYESILKENDKHIYRKGKMMMVITIGGLVSEEDYIYPLHDT